MPLSKSSWCMFVIFFTSFPIDVSQMLLAYILLDNSRCSWESCPKFLLVAQNYKIVFPEYVFILSFSTYVFPKTINS